MMAAQRIRNPKGELLEHGWMLQVVQLARLGGWRVFHAPDNRPSGRTGRPQQVLGETTGFPDLIMVRGHSIIAAELKTDTGRMGRGQQDWLDVFDAIGAALKRAVMRVPGATLPEIVDDHGCTPSVQAVVWRPRDIEQVQATLLPTPLRRAVAA